MNTQKHTDRRVKEMYDIIDRSHDRMAVVNLLQDQLLFWLHRQTNKNTEPCTKQYSLVG